MSDLKASETSIDTAFVLATPRSGSSLLCDLLNTRFVTCLNNEIFNPDYKALGEYCAAESDPRIFDFIESKKFRSHVPIPKILFQQLEFASKYPDFEKIFEKKIIYSRRRNKIQQAISLYIANKTNIWSSRSSRTPEMDEKDIAFNFDAIRSYQMRMEEHDYRLCEMLHSFGCDFICVDYETLAADKNRVLGEVQSFLDLKTRKERRKVQKRLERQKHANKDYLYNEYIKASRARFNSIFGV